LYIANVKAREPDMCEWSESKAVTQVIYLCVTTAVKYESLGKLTREIKHPIGWLLQLARGYILVLQ